MLCNTLIGPKPNCSLQVRSVVMGWELEWRRSLQCYIGNSTEMRHKRFKFVSIIYNIMVKGSICCWYYIVHLWFHLYRWSLGLTAGHRCTLTCAIKNWNHWSWKFAAGANWRQSRKRYVCMNVKSVCICIISNNLCIRWKEYESHIRCRLMELRKRWVWAYYAML